MDKDTVKTLAEETIQNLGELDEVNPYISHALLYKHLRKTMIRQQLILRELLAIISRLERLEKK